MQVAYLNVSTSDVNVTAATSGRMFLFYSICGERGIAAAEVTRR